MKISKSILSPGRSARDPSPFTSSLSRRLKSNGSLKGGQSPMFPSSSSSKKKTASGFDNPEPSSPKVTCIGQVRVKSRKKKNHNNNIRSRSHRRSTDYSFRRIDTNLAFGEDANNGLKRQSSTSYRNREIELESSQRQGHNNQKWVHIPVTICESLRSFGSDFNCFHPCRSSSCVSSGRNRKGSGGSSCGSVLARWLVEGEGVGDKGGRQIELVVGGEDEVYNNPRKRHVLEDIDIMEIEKNLKEKMGGFGRDEGDTGRVSICVPPKNALLLMRCGSDPVKMAAHANRFWEPPPPHNCPEDDDDDEKVVHVVNDEEEHTKKLPEECENTEQVDELLFTRAMLVPETEQSVSLVLETKCEHDNLCDEFVTEDEGVSDENLKVEQAVNGDEEANDMEIPLQHPSAEEAAAAADQLVTSPSSEREDYHEVDCEQQQQQCAPEQENDADEETAVAAALPDCLLLMMCEPKLSMEVSQETWVCSTDFIRCLPPREPNHKNKNDCAGAGEELSKRVSIHYKPPTAPPSKAAENQQFIPPRSSCSYPARPQNHEPARDSLYLTRCKSEPRRSTAKLAAAMPEGCFWKMEPRAPVGVSAAGVGF